LDKDDEAEKKKRGFDTFLYCQSMVVADEFGTICRARPDYDVNEAFKKASLPLCSLLVSLALPT
jgi:hypothetical protein